MSELKMHVGKPAAWLEITGEDSFDFLQGQCANDLRSNSSHPATYTLWLDRKGKVIADSFVLQQSTEKLYLLSYFSPAPILIERLESFIIADDVEVTDLTSQTKIASLWGVNLPEALEAAGLSLPEPGQFATRENWFLINGRRSSTQNADLIALGETAETLLASLAAAVERLGGTPATADELEHQRVAAAIPAVPADIGPGELPQEGHFQNIGLSYDKGCYLGQEVMARIRSMGQVRRSLVPVRLEADCQRGAALFHGEKEVGTLKSIAPGSPALGLALLRIDALQNTSAFSLEPAGKPAIFTLSPST